MAVPTPTIPTFTDGQIVHAADLNGLGSNLTNLYNYLNAGFTSQRPCVIAKQTTGQSIPNATNTLVNFQSAAVNTDNMWNASQPNQLTIQHAGIYLLYSQTRYGAVANSLSEAVTTSLLVNGTAVPGNAVSTQAQIPPSIGAGTALMCISLVNLAAGSTVYLNAWQSTTGGAITLDTAYGGTYLAAVFLTPST
ncbi:MULTISPECIES: TNF domain-containing protein [Amycolatopsis]|uniref:C1q domain-containing protein n=1 Tax=Amycolatopsis albidoflavus TaxID=102226 RepID=A0ABW5I5M5_9PSEU